jgi:hypothetical protein
MMVFKGFGNNEVTIVSVVEFFLKAKDMPGNRFGGENYCNQLILFFKGWDLGDGHPKSSGAAG